MFLTVCCWYRESSIPCATKKDDHMIIKIKDKKLANDIFFVMRSVGMKIIKKMCENFGNIISIYGDQNPKNNTESALLTKISIIEQEVDKYYGFVISGNHRYLLGDFTVTHNTLSMAGLIVRDKMEWNMDIPFTVEKN